jgi:hypothetical protein
VEERFTGNFDTIGSARISLHWNPTNAFQGIALHREGIEPLSRTGDAFRSNQGFNKYGINKGVNKGVSS